LARLAQLVAITPVWIMGMMEQSAQCGVGQRYAYAAVEPLFSIPEQANLKLKSSSPVHSIALGDHLEGQVTFLVFGGSATKTSTNLFSIARKQAGEEHFVVILKSRIGSIH
jgi:hypothetical protein